MGIFRPSQAAKVAEACITATETIRSNGRDSTEFQRAWAVYTAVGRASSPEEWAAGARLAHAINARKTTAEV
jgi:hypothetical protein